MVSLSSCSSAPLLVDADVDAIRALNEASDRPLSLKAAESSDASLPLTLEVPHSYLVVGGVVVAVGVAVWWWRAELEERVRRLLRR
jgi:type VI protein secretion system component VasF